VHLCFSVMGSGRCQRPVGAPCWCTCTVSAAPVKRGPAGTASPLAYRAGLTVQCCGRGTELVDDGCYNTCQAHSLLLLLVVTPFAHAAPLLEAEDNCQLSAVIRETIRGGLSVQGCVCSCRLRYELRARPIWPGRTPRALACNSCISYLTGIPRGSCSVLSYGIVALIYGIGTQRPHHLRHESCRTKSIHDITAYMPCRIHCLPSRFKQRSDTLVQGKEVSRPQFRSTRWTHSAKHALEPSPSIMVVVTSPHFAHQHLAQTRFCRRHPATAVSTPLMLLA
jgi:hypothetical protein